MKYDVITIGGATEDITFYTKEGMLIANRKDISRQKLLEIGRASCRERV